MVAAAALLCQVMLAAAEANASTISISARTTHRVPDDMNGCHFSSLDHQFFGVDSQMVYDESFEQSISDKSMTKEGPGDTVSLGWVNLSSTGAGWIVNSTLVYNGNGRCFPSSPPAGLNLVFGFAVSVQLTANQSLPRAGVAARYLGRIEFGA